MRHSVLLLSNIMWLVPAYIAFQNSSWLFVPALVTLLLSVIFHITNTHQWEIADMLFAIGYISCGPWLMREAQFEEWLLVVALSGLAGIIYFLSHRFRKNGIDRSYIISHSLWHVLTAIIAAVVYTVYFT